MSQSLYFVGIAQAIFATLLVCKKKERVVADKVLMLWIIAIGLDMLYSLLNITVLPVLPDLIIIPLSYGPLMYYYVHCVVHRPKSIPKSLYIHIAPIIILFLLALLFFPKDRPVDTVHVFDKGWFTVVVLVQIILYGVSTIGYWAAVVVEVKKYKKHFNNYYSNGTGESPIKWVSQVVLMLVGGFVLSILLYGSFVGLGVYPFNPILACHIGIILYLYTLTFYGVNQNSLLSICQLSSEIKKEESTPKLALKENDLQAIVNRLNNVMEEKKMYMSGDLTLQNVADEMNETSFVLSTVLNHYLKKNFFTYVNEFRVNEVKQRMKSEEYKNMTLISIAYDSGFNSKSSFNAIFKKFTGKTPSQFQKEL